MLCVCICVEVWLALLCDNQWCHASVPFAMAYLRTRSPKLCTNWSLYMHTGTSVLEQEEVFPYVFRQVQSVETADSLRVWKCGLSYFWGTCQSLSLRPESTRVFTRVLLSFHQWPQRQKATGNLRSCRQPSIRRHPSCLCCISGKDLLVSARAVQGVIVLSAWTSLCTAQWRHDNRIDYLQADYDVLRRLPKTSQFCDI